MGSGSFSTTAYASYSNSISRSTREEVFTQRHGKTEFLAKNINIREARDNEDHPESNPIIIGVDVTGSMGMLAEAIVKGQLGVLMNELLDRQPVSDPQVCFMAIGDMVTDQCPLQVTQFESDNRIVQQLTELYLEGNGGGNRSESYIGPWWFAMNHVVSDAWEKRKKKGYIFTIGDEECPAYLYKSDMRKHLSTAPEGDMISANDLFHAASERYNIFHLVIEQGSYCNIYSEQTISSWRNVIGRRTILVKNYMYLPHIIVSAIQIAEGRTPEDVISSWESNTVQDALKHAFGI